MRQERDMALYSVQLQILLCLHGCKQLLIVLEQELSLKRGWK
jgi:hypothetical protein